MLQILLGEHPQVSTTVELTLFTRYAMPWLTTWDEEKRNSLEGKWHQGLPFVWEREEVAAFLKTFVDRIYSKLQEKKPGATHILDKYPGNSMVVPLIRNFLPEARFIHVIRDGRDVACSMISAAEKIGFGTRTIRDSAYAWKRHFLAAQEARSYGRDYLEVRYEDLIGNGMETYRQVLNFCGLSYDEKWVASVIENNSFEKMKAARRVADSSVKAREGHYRSGRAGGWKETLSIDDRFEFERAAGDLLRELGYETSSEWWQESAVANLMTRVRSEIRRRVRNAARAVRRRLNHY